MGIKSTKKLATHLILVVALLIMTTCAQPLNRGGQLLPEPGFSGGFIPPPTDMDPQPVPRDGWLIPPPTDVDPQPVPRDGWLIPPPTDVDPQPVPRDGWLIPPPTDVDPQPVPRDGWLIPPPTDVDPQPVPGEGGITHEPRDPGLGGGNGGTIGEPGNYGGFGGDSSGTGTHGDRMGNYGGIGGANRRTGNYGGIDGPTTGGSGNFGGAPNNNNNDFCTRLAAMPKSCPSPPTMNTLDIGTLMGTYYEVGATASFKLRNELGVACTRTNFSFPQPAQPTAPDNDSDDDDVGIVINVENSGIPILESRPSTMSALSRMGMSTSNVCRSAARLCSSNLLSEALFRLSAITNELPYDSLILSQASSVIQGAIVGLHQRIDSVVRLTTEITRNIAAISQSGSSNASLNPLLHSLRSTAITANSQLRELAGTTVANLTTARNSIARVANRLSDPNAISLLMGTANLLHVQIEAVITEVSKVEQTISNIGGPLTDIIAADATGRNTAPTGSDNDLFKRVLISYGEAIQENPDEPGNFTLRLQMERFNQSSPYEAFDGRNAIHDTVSESSDDKDAITMPYKIIGLDGSPGMEYWSVLVYSCVPDPEGGTLPLSDLVLLSRAPSLPLRSVVGLLDVASHYGIPTECTSAFVPTLQTISDDHGHQYTCAA